MTVSLFPKGLCLKIDAKLRKFWWGENANGNSLMLKCWDSICLPKSCGGLGFRRMFDLNFALLSKLAWSVASDKDILWVKILRSKYLRGKFFLSDDLSFYNSSWLWKDFSNCRDLICKGALFHVYVNSDILIWKEPWIPTIPNFIPLNTNTNPNSLSLNLVKDLIDTRSFSWNLETLKTTFTAQVVKETSKIQISPLDRPKSLFWCPSLSGNFSSKSAYLTSQSLRLSPSTHNRPFNWNLLWNSKLHNRHKMLFWRILNDLLPCKDRLNRLFNISDTNYVSCSSDVENLDHIFIHCPLIQQVWFSSHWNFRIATFSHMSINNWIALLFYANNQLFNSNYLRIKFIIFTDVLFDLIWTHRNRVAHGNPISQSMT